MIVALESNTCPGTTEEMLRFIFEGKGLKVGCDFFLAFSPERIDPGNKRINLKNTPKVVGLRQKNVQRELWSFIR